MVALEVESGQKMRLNHNNRKIIMYTTKETCIIQNEPTMATTSTYKLVTELVIY